MGPGTPIEGGPRSTRRRAPVVVLGFEAYADSSARTALLVLVDDVQEVSGPPVAIDLFEGLGRPRGATPRAGGRKSRSSRRHMAGRWRAGPPPGRPRSRRPRARVWSRVPRRRCTGKQTPLGISRASVGTEQCGHGARLQLWAGAGLTSLLAVHPAGLGGSSGSGGSGASSALAGAAGARRSGASVTPSGGAAHPRVCDHRGRLAWHPNLAHAVVAGDVPAVLGGDHHVEGVEQPRVFASLVSTLMSTRKQLLLVPILEPRLFPVRRFFDLAFGKVHGVFTSPLDGVGARRRYRRPHPCRAAAASSSASRACCSHRAARRASSRLRAGPASAHRGCPALAPHRWARTRRQIAAAHPRMPDDLQATALRMIGDLRRSSWALSRYPHWGSRGRWFESSRPDRVRRQQSSDSLGFVGQGRRCCQGPIRSSTRAGLSKTTCADSCK